MRGEKSQRLRAGSTVVLTAEAESEEEQVFLRFNTKYNSGLGQVVAISLFLTRNPGT